MTEITTVKTEEPQQIVEQPQVTIIQNPIPEIQEVKEELKDLQNSLILEKLQEVMEALQQMKEQILTEIQALSLPEEEDDLEESAIEIPVQPIEQPQPEAQPVKRKITLLELLAGGKPRTE